MIENQSEKQINRNLLQILEKGFVMEKPTNQKILATPAPSLGQPSLTEPTLTELSYLSPPQLERFYGISVNRQKRLRLEKKLPYSKLGAYIRYSKDKINELFADHEVVA